MQVVHNLDNKINYKEIQSGIKKHKIIIETNFNS